MSKKMMTTLSVLGLAAICASPAVAAENETHLIGVPVYNIADEQVQEFREYLESYIESSFENVDFLYSQSIESSEEEMEFLQYCIDQGADGIMAFNSYDIEKEVNFCAENQVYFLRPSATVGETEFEKVADNPYFLGYFGPGEEIEYQAGADMAAWFAEQSYGSEYFILSGGAGMGNVMHLERTKGILDALQEAYQVRFNQTSEELASQMDVVTAEAGDLKVHICGGYVAVDSFFEAAKLAYEANPSDIVLGVIPIEEMQDVIGDAKLGIIDCFTDYNEKLFQEGKLQYVCGKYSSIIGPGFAAMYNAVTGHAEDFRDQGKAFAITQGFWVADSEEEYSKKHELSCGISLNAYSFTDLLSVIKEANADATLNDLKELANDWDFESALERTKG